MPKYQVSQRAAGHLKRAVHRRQGGAAGSSRPPAASPGIPVEDSHPNATQCDRRRQDPPRAKPPPALSPPAIWAGRGVGLSGVGSSGMSRRRARLPRGKGVRPGPFPRAPAGKVGPRGTGAATKEACLSPRPPPARGPPRRPGTRPAPGDPPCARAASRCHRRSLSRPSQTPQRAGRTKARPPPRRPLRLRSRPWHSPEARPRRARAPSRTK